MFTLSLEEFFDDNRVSTRDYTDIPISETTQGRLTVQHASGASPLQLDVQGDGVTDFTLQPSAKTDPAESLPILAAIIKTLRLPQGIEQSLVSMLDTATAAFRRGDRQAGLGVLGAFANYVQAQKAVTIAQATADALIGIAQKLLGSVWNRPGAGPGAPTNRRSNMARRRRLTDR